MAGQATLTWKSDVGFELDLNADLEDIRLRFAAVPVPADGTVELAQGVELNKLDILFKCQAMIDGAPAQLQDATIAVTDGKLKLEAHLEDVENGLLYPLETELSCPLPTGVPESGGIRNESPDEDELDWGDETTFEAVAGELPDAALLTEEREFNPGPEEQPEGEPPRGLAALLAALKNVDEEPPPAAPAADDEGEDDPSSWDTSSSAPEAGDQIMSARDEALSLLKVLEAREDLEIEDGHTVDELASGTADILALPVSDDAKAARLSEWLLDQPAIGDLFIDDESLAELVAQW